MDREIDITVTVDGQEWELIGAFYDHEAGAVAYEDIKGPCVRYLPEALRDRIEGEATIEAYKQEQERQMGEVDYHLEAAYEDRYGGEG